MSRPSIFSLAASLIIGGACFVAISNDASAYSSSGIAIWQPGVYRGGALRGAYYRGAYYRGGYYRDGAPGVALGAAPAGAYYSPRRVYYPYGPRY